MTDGEGRLAREGEMAPGQVLARGDPPVRAEVVRQRRHLPSAIIMWQRSPIAKANQARAALAFRQ